MSAFLATIRRIAGGYDPRPLSDFEPLEQLRPVDVDETPLCAPTRGAPLSDDLIAALQRYSAPSAPDIRGDYKAFCAANALEGPASIGIAPGSLGIRKADGNGFNNGFGSLAGKRGSLIWADASPLQEGDISRDRDVFDADHKGLDQPGRHCLIVGADDDVMPETNQHSHQHERDGALDDKVDAIRTGFTHHSLLGLRGLAPWVLLLATATAVGAAIIIIFGGV